MFSLLLDLVPGTEMDGDYCETGLGERALGISVFRKSDLLWSRKSGLQNALHRGFLLWVLELRRPFQGSGPTPSIKHTWNSLFSQWLSVEMSVLFICMPSIVFLSKLQQLLHTLGACAGSLTRRYVIPSKVLAPSVPLQLISQEERKQKYQRHAMTPC